MENNYPVQGNDPRMNSEKPETSPMVLQNTKGMLEVWNDEAKTQLYFFGRPEFYMGGATHQESLEEDFVGDLSRGLLKNEWSTGVEYTPEVE